jgi:NADH:ubiquinone oxidoreductase subunit C
MRSTIYNHTVVLKTRISDRENPVLDSVTDIWQTAEFHEREVYDLLGIKFNNHPDLRRLFLDNSWGFPLRKDYVDDINIVTK